MQAEVKTKNRKKLKAKALVDSGCIHIGINEQLVKNKRIQMKPLNFSLLWQPLITKANDYTSGKSLRVDIK